MSAAVGRLAPVFLLPLGVALHRKWRLPSELYRMQHITLGSSDLRVTPICLGTMTFGEQVNEADSHAILSHSLARGVNFIDTAEMYSVPARAETWRDQRPSSATGLPRTPVPARSWCWPPRWLALRVACPGCAKARA